MNLLKYLKCSNKNILSENGRREARNYRQPATFEEWIRANNLAPPCPAEVKYLILARHHIPGATWIETGTHLGETAKFLASISKEVYTIEP